MNLFNRKHRGFSIVGVLVGLAILFALTLPIIGLSHTSNVSSVLVQERTLVTLILFDLAQYLSASPEVALGLDGTRDLLHPSFPSNELPRPVALLPNSIKEELRKMKATIRVKSFKIYEPDGSVCPGLRGVEIRVDWTRAGKPKHMDTKQLIQL